MINTCFKRVSAPIVSAKRLLSSMSSQIISSSPNPGPIECEIITKLKESLKPTYVKVSNDSAKHAHHAGIRGASNTTESHFRIEIISDEFANKNLPSRHRLVYNILDEELKSKGVHALQLKTKTEQELNK
ncbi:Piso0_000289 [Millerozyma farinosa CBS 7064]|uniref:Piso0_000289 protein n=1 Tax=Pichia sorbitophila (strain ATCC MYA-4447 / BCRC 22081 / CBS 7064 / NBRC 10061 / NRRL Y-12695) TaxID=559304 RepID=G8YTK8_PICSO|nr:Piso0_000289 [Millerozyma farinosa CBS 7064]